MKNTELRNWYIQKLYEYREIEQRGARNQINQDSVPWEIYKPVMERLQKLIPSSIKENVQKAFNFKQGSVEDKFNLADWMNKKLFTSRWGIDFTNFDEALSLDEISILNKAWKDFLRIEESQMHIDLVHSSLSKEIENDLSKIKTKSTMTDIQIRDALSFDGEEFPFP